jgi:hypothetical protein
VKSAIVFSLMVNGSGYRAFRSADQVGQDPLAGLSDLPPVLELKLQLFNYLGQSLSR